MKTLKDHTIIYDDECPMCKEYTRAFVKTGMLDSQGRVGYTEVAKSGLPNIDWKRARNEIALFNRKDNSVRYGVDSLTTIIGHSLPFLKPLFEFGVFRTVVSQLYAFISYNRKVVVPGLVFEGRNTCTPDLNYTYRWAYIMLAWLVTSGVLMHYSALLAPLIGKSSFYREFLICGGQIVFQGIIVGLIKRDRWIHYLGNVMTISLVGALLLTPMFLFSIWVDSAWFYAGYFMIIVGLMLAEHVRRVRILELPGFVSATWVLYRLLVLFYIL